MTWFTWTYNTFQTIQLPRCPKYISQQISLGCIQQCIVKTVHTYASGISCIYEFHYVWHIRLSSYGCDVQPCTKSGFDEFVTPHVCVCMLSLCVRAATKNPFYIPAHTLTINGTEESHQCVRVRKHVDFFVSHFPEMVFVCIASEWSGACVLERASDAALTILFVRSALRSCRPRQWRRRRRRRQHWRKWCDLSPGITHILYI